MRHLRLLALLLGAALALIMAINVVIDPWGLFRCVVLPGINADKPEFQGEARRAKAWWVHWLRPAGVVLGSSRAEFAIDPQHPGWGVPGPVYNFALPSGRLSEAYFQLLHTAAGGRLRRVVLELDMFMFDAARQQEPGFSTDRLDLPGHSGAAGRGDDLATALLSLSAVTAAYRTLREQGSPRTVGYLADGARAPEQNARFIDARGGHRAAFVSNLDYSLGAADGWATLSVRRTDGSAPGLEHLAALVRFCREAGIELDAYLSPLHAFKLEGLWQLGLWPAYEQWQRDVVTTFADAAGDSPQLRLWSFNGYNTITTEAIPPAQARGARMRWYWEGSHYRRETGDLILARMFGAPATPAVPKDFGVRLTPGSLAGVLAQARTGHAQWCRLHADEVALVASRVRATAPQRARWSTPVRSHTR